MSEMNNPEALFRAKSRTFSLAARLFSRADQEAVAQLYYFCRVLDDLADASALGDTESLEKVIRELGPSVSATEPLVLDFIKLATERGLSIEAATLLAEALREDCGPRQIENESELIGFAFGVAGTVGVLMCPVLGVSDRDAVPFAIDLGIALQLTNVARDVLEDAQRARYYLPREWIDPETIKAAIGGDGAAIQEVDGSIKRLVELAEVFYNSAFEGLWFIRSRNRPAVYFASMLYREIGQSLLRLGSGSWRRRRTLSSFEKLKVCWRGLWQFRKRNKRQWAGSNAPAHRVELMDQLKEAGIPFERLEA
jgi:phytoene synthase